MFNEEAKPQKYNKSCQQYGNHLAPANPADNYFASTILNFPVPQMSPELVESSQVSPHTYALRSSGLME